MEELRPYIENGKRYYNTLQAAHVIGAISQRTIWAWAKAGVTKFGFELDTKETPTTTPIPRRRHNARTHRNSRLLIPEEKVLALKEILDAAGKKKPGPWSPGQMAELKLRANNYRRSGSPFTLHH